MAETAEAVQTTETTTEQQPSIQELAAFAFNKPLPEQQSGTTGGDTQTGTQQQTATTETQQQATTPDYTPFIKETFGVDTIEEVKAQWQQLQELKANPPKAEPFKFENEESEKLARAINANPKEAFKILERQERIESVLVAEVSKETAPDIIKLGLQLKYPTLTQSQIEFQYKQEYGIPKEPVLKDTDDETEFQERHDAWKEQVANIEMKTTIAATMAKPELEAAKQKIVLPDTQQLTQDKEYEAYKASNASAAESYDKVIAPSIKALKESDVPLSFSVNDANNKMQFDISIIPDAADFESARQDSLTLDVMKNCYDKDGKFLPQNLQRIILLDNNFDKYGQAIARQAVNAERKRVIEQETAGGGGRRDFNTLVETTELDQLKQFAFQKTG